METERKRMKLLNILYRADAAGVNLAYEKFFTKGKACDKDYIETIAADALVELVTEDLRLLPLCSIMAHYADIIINKLAKEDK